VTKLATNFSYRILFHDTRILREMNCSLKEADMVNHPCNPMNINDNSQTIHQSLSSRTQKKEESFSMRFPHEKLALKKAHFSFTFSPCFLLKWPGNDQLLQLRN
jgi:hypothetical protein